MRDAKNIPRTAHPETVYIYSSSESVQVDILCNTLNRAGHKAVVVENVHKLSGKRQDKLVVMADESEAQAVKQALPKATVVVTGDSARGSVKALEGELDKRSERQATPTKPTKAVQTVPKTGV